WRGLQIGLLVSVAAAFVLLPAVGRLVRGGFAALPVPARGALAGVALLGLASSLLSVRPLYALRQYALLALLFLLVIAVASGTAALGDRGYRTVAGVVALSALAYVTLFLAVLLVDPWNMGGWRVNLFVGYANPRFFGQLQSWTLPLMVVPVLDRRGTPPLARAAFGLAAAGWWMLFLVSGSRAPALSLAVAVVVTLACFGRRALPWLGAQGAALAAGIARYNLVPGLGSSSQTGVASAVARGATDTGRSLLWRHAADLMAGSPGLGVGPGNYAFFRALPGIPSPAGYSAHPHNAALQWGAEWGVPAALLLLAVLVWGMWSWLRAGRRAEDGGPGGLLPALTAALVAAAVHSCVDGMLVMPLPQTVGAVVLGLALGVHLRRAGTPARPAVRYGAPLSLAAAALAAAVLAATFRLPAVEPGPREQLQPAFWVHGAIP
ncbi:MAG: O-antigen ligase family protein, partial [Gemmatimonadetes bacterium]|nr:O-antigen ligase family protein [Gemmatimonadota bacterium]